MKRSKFSPAGPPAGGDGARCLVSIESRLDTLATGMPHAEVKVPTWAALGAEVEGCETSPGFEGAYASGELIEWLAQLPASEEAVMIAAATAASSGKANSPKGSKSPPKAATALGGRSQGPWARMQSRILVKNSPYVPNGILMTERWIPLERLRPRPPPPPAAFLDQARIGDLLQLRVEGLWWDVTLVGVSVVPALPASDAPSESAQAQAAAAGVPRYHVVSAEYSDVCGIVLASALRPRWNWSDGHWSAEVAREAEELPNLAKLPLQPPLPPPLPPALASSAADRFHGTKGMGVAEVMGQRVRAWIRDGDVHSNVHSNGHGAAAAVSPLPVGSVAGGAGTAVGAGAAAESIAIAEIGVALGYVEGYGLSVQFDDGAYWVRPGDAWEWLPADEEDRPMGFHFHSADTRRRGWMDHARVRVWLRIATGERLSRVGPATGFSPRRGVRVRLADGPIWVGNADMWRWVKPTEECHPAEFTPLPCGVPTLPTDGGTKMMLSLAHGADSSYVPNGPHSPASPRHHHGPIGAVGANAGASTSDGGGGGGGSGSSHGRPLTVGSRVELWGRDEGFEGSWYRAEVVQLESKLEDGRLSAKRVRVAIDELLEEGSPEDWVYTPPEAVWDGAEWREIGSGDREIGSPEGAGAGADVPASEKAVPKAARRAGGKAAGKVVDHRLREWWPLKRLRPLPPPPPAGFSSMLHVGDAANVAVEGGWWDVVVVDGRPHGASDEKGTIAVMYERASKVHGRWPLRASDDY